jgi:hypothetical protein
MICIQAIQPIQLITYQLVQQPPVYFLGTETPYLNSPRRMQHSVSIIILSACQVRRCTVSEDTTVVKLDPGYKFFCQTLALKPVIFYCITVVRL